MPEDRPTIAICGATGKQGGAVLHSLLAQDRWRLIALTRDPDGEAARVIRARGIEVRRADLEDKEALTAAFTDAHGVYGVTTPMTSKGRLDTSAEYRQGVAIADACVAAGVRHLVLSTVMDVDDREPTVPYIRTKRRVEQYVVDRSIPHTFLCPASFMDEIGGEYLPVKRGVVTGQADNDAKVPYVACSDIGEFAAMAFADRDQFLGRRFNLIGDFLTGTELAEVLGRVNGHPVRHKAPPMWLMWIFARQWITLRKTFEEWGRPPHPERLLRGIDECRRLRPQMLDFEAYLRTTSFSA